MVFRLTCILLLLSASLFGQAQSSAGDLRGRVIDASQASIARAKLTITDPERGLTRSTESDLRGEFALPLLPPGIYRLRVEAQGFATKTYEALEIRVGDALDLSVEMSVGAVTTEILVEALAPVVETGRYQQANTIESARIRDLPINRRNYLDFVLLAPGVADTTDMADGTDYRVAQAPHSGISFGGGVGRGNAFFVDGVEFYSNTGGIRPSVSQEAVQEFQINRNTFSAEFGWVMGGTVNIITKTGSNLLHGNLFGFLRHRDIQARNYFDPQKSSFTRSQAGATLGGAIKPDRSFFYAAFERLDRQETAFVPILQDRSAFTTMTASQRELFDFFNASGQPLLRGLAAQASQLLVPNNNPVVVNTFRRNSGVFPFGEDLSMLSLRLDHRFSDNHSFFFRGSVAKNLQENSQFGALVAFNRGRSFDIWDSTLTIHDTLILSPSWIVETKGMFNYGRFNIIPTDPNGPEINITGFGFFGRDIFLPSRNAERHYQLLQNWSHHSGKQHWKFGWDINPVSNRGETHTFMSGRFGFGEAIPLASVLVSATGDPTFPATLASTLTALGQARLIANMSAPISALQAYSLGLPTFYQQGFGNPVWTGWSKRYGFYGQRSWNPHSKLTLNISGRYDLEVNEPVLGTDKNNVAPRFGFSWAPTSDGLTVVRGGYGIYYSPTNLQIANVADSLSGAHIHQVLVPITGVSFVTNPRTGRPLTSSDIYQGLLAQGVIGRRPIEAADILQFGLRPSAGFPGRVIFGSDPVVNPYAQQASLEIERAIGDYALSVGYNFNRGAHIVRILGRNLVRTGTLPDGRPTFTRIDPTILQKNIFDYGANSFYHAGIVQLTRRFRRNFALNVHYTWSKAIDEATDFNSDFSPHDQLNARAERALSSFHHAHRFVANALIVSPLKPGAGHGLAHDILGAWNISPIIQANSWRPFNPLTGVDILGDGYTTNKRPHMAGRNIGQGPNFFTFDMRAARRFGLGQDGKLNLEFIAEGFNLLNRTNFRTVNNTVGDVPLSSLPNPLRAVRGSPTAPLSYTSALDARQFQFALKVHF